MTNAQRAQMREEMALLGDIYDIVADIDEAETLAGLLNQAHIEMAALISGETS